MSLIHDCCCLSSKVPPQITGVRGYLQYIHYKTYYMSESVFAMRLVNLRSVTCCGGTKFAKKMLISEL